MLKKVFKRRKKKEIYIKEVRPDMTQCRIILIDKKGK